MYLSNSNIRRHIEVIKEGIYELCAKKGADPWSLTGADLPSLTGVSYAADNAVANDAATHCTTSSTALASSALSGETNDISSASSASCNVSADAVDKIRLLDQGPPRPSWSSAQLVEFYSSLTGVMPARSSLKDTYAAWLAFSIMFKWSLSYEVVGVDAGASILAMVSSKMERHAVLDDAICEQPQLEHVYERALAYLNSAMSCECDGLRRTSVYIMR